jgi:hypothetical protein
LTTNFEKIDKKKFENFIKVNQKSKVLSMQLQDNYYNATLLPAAIAGDSDINYKEIEEQMLYGPNDNKRQIGFLSPSPARDQVTDFTYQMMPQY